MYACDKTLTLPVSSDRGTRRNTGLPASVEPFRAFVPCQANSHPNYGFFAVLSLLMPPLGFLFYLLLSFSRNALDKALARTLFWRALTLPVTCLSVYYLSAFLLRLSPQGRLWMW